MLVSHDVSRRSSLTRVVNERIDAARMVPKTPATFEDPAVSREKSRPPYRPVPLPPVGPRQLMAV